MRVYLNPGILSDNGILVDFSGLDYCFTSSWGSGRVKGLRSSQSLKRSQAPLASLVNNAFLDLAWTCIPEVVKA